MTAQYELTKDDVSAFNLYHHFHSPTARRHYYRAWIIPALIWLLICIGIWHLADKTRGTPLRTFLDLLPLFSGVALHLAIFPWWYRRKVRNIVAGMISEGQNRGLLSRHEVTISPEKVTSSNEFGQSSTAWRAVERVVLAGDYIFVYTNALAAIIVPQRAFASRDEFEQFANAASDFRARAIG